MCEDGFQGVNCGEQGMECMNVERIKNLPIRKKARHIIVQSTVAAANALAQLTTMIPK